MRLWGFFVLNYPDNRILLLKKAPPLVVIWLRLLRLLRLLLLLVVACLVACGVWFTCSIASVLSVYFIASCYSLRLRESRLFACTRVLLLVWYNCSVGYC